MEEIKYNLFLDDYRIPMDCIKYMGNNAGLYNQLKWVIVRSHDAFIKYITANGLPELVSFDHDLADEHYAPVDQYERYDEWSQEQGFKEKTGYESAKWLTEYCHDNGKPFPKWLVHSMNPTGKKNIEAYIGNYLKHVEGKE
jgi:hypothetical protein